MMKMTNKKTKEGGVGYQNADVKVNRSVQYKNAMGCLTPIRDYMKNASTETLSSFSADSNLRAAEAEAESLLKSIRNLRDWQNHVHV